MKNTNWTESEIQALKAQEAKDLAVQLLEQLRDKERAPVSAGQVQLKELEFELKIKEAEAEDDRLREAHAERIKQLELQIEQERRTQAEANGHADQVRQEHARLVEQVRASEESLSVQLERATREHRAKTEMLEAEYEQRKRVLEGERSQLEEDKRALIEAIQELTDLSELAQDVAQLRDEIAARRAAQHKELERLDEEFEATKFEKNKKINLVKRDHDLELIELESQHRTEVMQRSMEAATKTLSEADMLAVAKADWNDLQQRSQRHRDQEASVLNAAQAEAKEELKKAYNITTAEVFDVTELYYREKSMAQEAGAMREQISKLDSEITRMRQHIEHEPDRISKAVAAAKVQIQNNIEQGGSR